MIEVYATASASIWLGIAYIENRIVATSVGSSKDQTLRSLLRNLPSSVHYRVVEKGSEFAERAILALQEAHMGKGEFRDFALAEEFFSEPVARVLKTAAAR